MAAALQEQVTAACSRVLELEDVGREAKIRIAEKTRVLQVCQRALQEQRELAEAKHLNHQRLAQAIEEMQQKRDRLAEQNAEAREVLKDVQHRHRIADASRRTAVSKGVELLTDLTQHSSSHMHDPKALQHARQELHDLAQERAAVRKRHADADMVQKAVDKKIAALRSDQQVLARVLKDVA
eukprot:TRINITY_DN5204_c0_g1_i2.p4 TRINITY_DN5204_c0_g1~~TRINITY_DN5204_c0_g1_i2.p4  ORF type:complete len:182 (+),score=68.83 TRINITY_DN5204_c0_g1_i2:61-606(+)